MTDSARCSKLEPKAGLEKPRVLEKVFRFLRFLVNVKIRYMSSSVRPSVCLSSVTFVHPTQAIEIFGNVSSFYSASALLAMQSAVLARGTPSVRPSVRLSVRHVPVLCPDE